MAINERWREWLDRLQADGALPNPSDASVVMRRAMQKALETLEGPGPELASVRALTVPGPGGPLPARAYTPLAAGVAPNAGLVFFHGGGFLIGDLDTHDRLCRRLAAAARARIVSVEYRLAPEHKFPAAVDDALAAFDWATGEGAETLGFDPARVAVGGDSAGGNLAAVVAQSRRGPGPRPAFQLLIYPLLQLVETNVARLKVLEGHLMSTAIIDRVRAAYLPDRSAALDPRVSPILSTDLSGLAPAYIVTAGLDPLAAEGRAYAERLEAAGVRVRHVHYPTMTHGFFQFTAVSDGARDAIDEAGRALASALDEGFNRPAGA